MGNRKLNLQTVVAVLFIFILVTATVTTIFGQEKTGKEYTKIIQIKVVEDENGEVKSIDTILVMDRDKDFEFEGFYDLKTDWLVDSLNLLVDFECDHVFMGLDSMLHNITVDMHELDSLNTQMMFISSDGDLHNIAKEFDSYSFYFDGIGHDCDSVMKIIEMKCGDDTDSSMIRHIKHININSKDENIIIKTSKDGNKSESTIEYIYIMNEEEDMELEDIDVDIEMKVVKDGKEILIWIDENDGVYKIDEMKFELETVDEKEVTKLKQAGVKTKKHDLMVEDLLFSPNPNNGKFNLSFHLKEKKKVTINIYDIRGNLVYTETLKDFQGDFNKEIDISDRGEGTFFLQIVQGLYDIIKKIIIQ